MGLGVMNGLKSCFIHIREDVSKKNSKESYLNLASSFKGDFWSKKNLPPTTNHQTSKGDNHCQL